MENKKHASGNVEVFRTKSKKILLAIPEALYELMEDSRVRQGYTRTNYLIIALKRQLFIEGYTKS